MRVLLDTHALLWWLDGDERLSQTAQVVVGDETNEVLVSAASAWEIAIKVRIGKLPGAVRVAAEFMACLDAQGFEPLDITPEPRFAPAVWAARIETRSIACSSRRRRPRVSC